MSDRTSFDQLPTELFYEIFEYLSYNDIFYAFFYLNERINSILLQHDPFLYRFTLNFIDESEQWNELILLKIKDKNSNQINTRQVHLTENYLCKNQYLRKFNEISYSNVNSAEFSMYLRSLSLKIDDCKFLSRLLDVTPNLKDLNFLLLNLLNLNKKFISNVEFSPIELEKLSLVTESDTIHENSFLFLTSSFIKQFSSSLIYLSLDFHQCKTQGFQINGHLLEQQILHSMIELKSFHLYMQLDGCILDVKPILSTFQNQFWMNHQWTFAVHGKYIYTIPFHFDQLNDFSDFHQIESNNSNVLNSLHTWSHVKSIDFYYSCSYESNLIEEIQLKMPNLTSAAVRFLSPMTINRIKSTNISFNSINTLYCKRKFFEEKKHCLHRLFPNVQSVILS